jgi:hypothetical protein
MLLLEAGVVAAVDSLFALLVTMNLSLFRPHAAGAIERGSGNIEPVCAVAARRLEIVRRRPGAEFGG